MGVVDLVVGLIALFIAAYIIHALTREKVEKVNRVIIRSKISTGRFVNYVFEPRGRAIGATIAGQDWAYFYLPSASTVGTERVIKVLKNFKEDIKASKIEHLIDLEWVNIVKSNIRAPAHGRPGLEIFPVGGILFRIKVSDADYAGEVLNKIVYAIQRAAARAKVAGAFPAVMQLAAIAEHKYPIEIIAKKAEIPEEKILEYTGDITPVGAPPEAPLTIIPGQDLPRERDE